MTCLVTSLASLIRPAPILQATRVVAPTFTAENMDSNNIKGWLVSPMEAIAAGPTRPTMIISPIPKRVAINSSMKAGQVSLNT